MEKQLNRKLTDVSSSDNPPGCLWSVLHVVRSYQWHNVKKMVPHKRIVSRRLIGGGRYSRLKTHSTDNSVSQGSVDAEGEDTKTVEVSESNSGDASGKAHIKDLIAEEMSQQDKKSAHKRVRSYQRTESIHHLDPWDDKLPDEVRDDGKSPVTGQGEADASAPDNAQDNLCTKTPELPVPCCNGCELCGTMVALKNMSHSELEELGRQLLGNALLQNKLERAKEAISRENAHATDAKEPLKDTAFHQSRGLLDALEMLNVNNKLLQNARLDSNYAMAQHIQALQASNAKRGLTKSESFPIAESSKRIKPPSKLKPMQKEVNEKAVTLPKKVEETPDPEKVQAYPKSSVGAPVELKRRRFKDFRQKIKNAIKESRKEGHHHISMDAFFHKMPYGSKFFRHGKRSKDIANSAPGTSKGKSMRRSQSLNESMDKYSHLYEISYGEEAKKHASDNSHLGNSCQGSSVLRGPKGLNRILSLPELRSYCLFQHDESGEALASTIPSRASVDKRTSTETKTIPSVRAENQTESDESIEDQKQEKSATVTDTSAPDEDQTKLISEQTGNELAAKDETINDLDNLRNVEDGSVSLREQEAESAPVYISRPTKLLLSEGVEFEPTEAQVEQLESLASVYNQSVMESVSEAISPPDLNRVNLHISHSLPTFRNVQVDKKDEADFNYVRDILKISGFSVNECLGTWYSPEQPVDPSLFEEMESCSPLESDYSEGEVSSSYDHQLLFDLINEVLLEIYDRSFTYWPWPLSCNCHIRPMPTGIHVLEEVWGSISWYLNSQPEFEPLDYLVVRDLSKSDGWMNLQLDSECVGLELEEMIMDDLLDELIYE